MKKLNGSFRFWGLQCLECTAITAAGGGLLMGYTFLIGGVDISPAKFGMAFFLDLFLAGMMVVCSFMVSYFTVYFPLLISMNVTRKEAVRGLMGSAAGLSLLIVLLEAAVSVLVGGIDAAVFLPAMAGVFLGLEAIFIFGGCVIFRVGKMGIFLVLAMAAALIAGCGVGAVKVLPRLIGADGGLLLMRDLIVVSGIALFLGSGLFARFLLKSVDMK